MKHQPAPASAVFTPENGAAINRAYAEAIDSIGQMAKQERRAELAEHMLILARNGELDERRLCGLSVLAVLGRTPEHEPRHAPHHRANERG